MKKAGTDPSSSGEVCIHYFVLEPADASKAIVTGQCKFCAEVRQWKSYVPVFNNVGPWFFSKKINDMKPEALRHAISANDDDEP